MTRLLRLGLLATWMALLLSACSSTATPAPTAIPTPHLDGIKEYLLGQTSALVAATAQLQTATSRYYQLAETTAFDYTALWQNRRDEAMAAIVAAREAWIAASPIYEKMEGIVAGTPSLAQFDVDLDAGAAGNEDPDNAVSFDLALADGRTLPKPGNLFGVTESALWGTEPAFTAPVATDWNGNGTLEFGEALPDAYVLQAGVDLLAQKARELDTAARAWTPTESDAFTALVVMVPTMSEYFASWRDSRFVLGETSTQRDFNVISRLADIQDILDGLEIVYAQVRPQVATIDPAQAEQIATGLRDLKTFVAGIYAQERSGRRFTPEEADTLGAEAQNRATAITGQLSQMAGALGIPLAE